MVQGFFHKDWAKLKAKDHPKRHAEVGRRPWPPSSTSVGPVRLPIKVGHQSPLIHFFLAKGIVFESEDWVFFFCLNGVSEDSSSPPWCKDLSYIKNLKNRVTDEPATLVAKRALKRKLESHGVTRAQSVPARATFPVLEQKRSSFNIVANLVEWLTCKNWTRWSAWYEHPLQSICISQHSPISVWFYPCSYICNCLRMPTKSQINEYSDY